MKKEATHRNFALTKENYKLLAIGFVIVIIGFLLMLGGGSDDYTFSEEIFNFRRRTLAPMIILTGFIFEIYAIMKKPKVED